MLFEINCTCKPHNSTRHDLVLSQAIVLLLKELYLHVNSFGYLKCRQDACSLWDRSAKTLRACILKHGQFI